MNQKLLMEGLEFIKHFQLSQRETEILLRILKEPCSASSLSSEFKRSLTTIYHLIQRLKLKNLITIFDIDKNRNIFYQFNESVLV